ncbi:Cas4 exonuclease [Mycobacterium phage Phillis]|nr:Cas4 exonuclease [Mycobacterium phage Phillis]
MAEQKKIHRSVSQYNQYNKCPQSYKLARIDKVWQRPAAWLMQGTAFHATVEVVARDVIKGQLEGGSGPSYDSEITRGDARTVFTREYDKDISAATRETPNVQFWSRSGPYVGKVDIERRYDLGLEQLERWFEYMDANPDEKIWTLPNGEPALEVEFNIELGMDPSCPVHAHQLKDEDCDCGVGPVKVKGFIDAIVERPDGSLRIRDWKTGNTPGDDFQLGVYRVAIFLMFGVWIDTGDYWMAGKKGVKKGKPTKPYDLLDWDVDTVTEKFLELEANIRAEKFEAAPEPSKCQFCDVSASCSFAMG